MYVALCKELKRFYINIGEHIKGNFAFGIPQRSI